MYKKEDLLKKENYKPEGLFLHVSKIFKRIIYKQINFHIQEKLSKHITGFRKSYGTQHSLITMLEKWKSTIDNGENIFIIFMYLSNAFGKINHDLLLAKIKAYRSSINVSDLMCSNLKKQRQSVKRNNNFSSAKKVHVGVPKVSLMDLLYLIYL